MDSLLKQTVLGVLRHLQGMRTLHEQVQSLLHWEPGTAQRVPLARSTWSDALSSRRRSALLQAAMAPLLTEAWAVLPDSLAQFRALQDVAQFPPILAPDHFPQPTRTSRGVSEQRVRPRARRHCLPLLPPLGGAEIFRHLEELLQPGQGMGRRCGGHRESGPPSHCHQPLGGPAGARQNGSDEKALRKQGRRPTSKPDGTDRPGWSAPQFRYTSEVSRQVLRFFKLCFHKSASQARYEAQLQPLLLVYP
jgi:hypothetical protein